MNTSSKDPWNDLDQSLRRVIATARAARAMSWEDVASAVNARGWEITAGNLMTRHSRMAFRADEYMLILDVLGVKDLAVRAPHVAAI